SRLSRWSCGFRLLLGAGAEHGHLGGWTDLGVVGADGHELHVVAVPFGHLGGPGAELRAGPLEAVVAVPNVAGRLGLPAHVVLDVRRRDEDGPGAGGTEHG